MELLSDEQAIRWCAERGLQPVNELPSTRIGFPGGESYRLRLAVAGSATEVVGLGYALAMTAVPGDDETAFQGGLLWLQDWDIWSETTERVGHLLLNSLRQSAQGASPVRTSPAHVFHRSEFIEAHAALAVALLFQWDAFYVPVIGAFYAFLSHHGQIEVVARDKVTYSDLLARFERGGFSPAAVVHS
ncbi:MAG: hypothetical protein IPJ57_14110 [Gemmatimonadetes bacterium]|nr:hypothetical protein [Gemmatimonadota bacterium]